MPHMFNAGRRGKIPKQRHRVTNWAKYNEGLRRRGDLTAWISEDVLDLWPVPRRSTRGEQRRYSDLAIELCLTLCVVFRQPLRQTQGFMLSLAKLREIKITVPDFPLCLVAAVGCKCRDYLTGSVARFCPVVVIVLLC